jgi:hypothetical protein
MPDRIMESHRCNICNIMIETNSTADHISTQDHISRKNILEKALEDLRKNQSNIKDDSVKAKWHISVE